jgi:hypothetical protein
VALCGLLETLLEGKEDVFIASADLLEKTKQTPGLQWIGSTKSLGTFLSKLDFVSRKNPAGNKRVYAFDRDSLNDLKLRYTPSPSENLMSDPSEPASNGRENDFFKASEGGSSDT